LSADILSIFLCLQLYAHFAMYSCIFMSTEILSNSFCLKVYVHCAYFTQTLYSWDGGIINIV
jgi:hypothetical protein